MGMATVNYTKHRPPAWMQGYANLAHCAECGTVFNKTTQFVRGYNVSEGTQPSSFVKVSNCKVGCCPVCDTPISE